MSIYATAWIIKIEDRSNPEGWTEIWAQAVPAHIGQPSEGYEDGDPYEDYLPPIIKNYDPYSEEDYPARAIVIVQKGRNNKEGQRYVDPLMILTNEEYEKINFPDLLSRIYRAIREKDKRDGRPIR